ncbi:Phosphatidate cytidylyltransferase [Candidatus Magnetomorum sp. HK-1]|nr:Phosphatidate cytidylyltransferase [Candidatus Magnetomorum sp. HK-1]
MNTELAKRWQTALVALPVLFLIIYGSFSFIVLVLMASILCMYEFCGIVLKDTPITHEVCILGFILTPVWILTLHMGYSEYVWIIPVINLLIAAAITVFRFQHSPDIIETITRQITGLIYIPGLLCFLVLIRQFENGHFWIYLSFMMVFACDTGGYFVGKKFGKHPLCKAVSPKKTIEGFLGGCILCIITCLIFASLFGLPIPIEHMIGLSLVVGIFAPLGDLFESVLKRVSDIKDSGNILPGHGGILDRIDALMFAGPLIYGYKILFIG